MVASVISPDTSKTYNVAAGGAYEVRGLPASPGAVIWNMSRNKAYRLCQVEDLATVAGNVVCFSTDGATNRYEVTPDRAGGTSVNTLPAGVAIVACADASYQWVQCRGLGDVAIVTDGGVAQGDLLIPHATTDGGVDTAAGTETTESIVGTALVADTGTALAAGEYTLACPVDTPAIIA